MRPEQVNVRATAEQIRRWRAKADEVRRTLSDWMRLALDEAASFRERPRRKKP